MPHNLGASDVIIDALTRQNSLTAISVATYETFGDTFFFMYPIELPCDSFGKNTSLAIQIASRDITTGWFLYSGRVIAALRRSTG